MGRLRAAVVGASGIGKHHAKWFARLGCSVEAFAGTSPGSVTATSQALKGLCGFSGRGYVGATEMFGAVQCDVVSICSPQEVHYENFMAAIDHGASVMCEKPLLYDPSLPAETVLAQAEEMVEAARGAGVVAAINTQYVAAAAAYRDLMRQRGVKVDQPTSFFMQMDSRGGDDGTDHENIWVDLGPHPLSVLMAFCGPGEMIEGSARFTVAQKSVEAAFDYQPAEGPVCSARIVCCNRPEGDLVRRFGVNDVLVDYEGRNDDSGVYKAYLTYEGDEIATQDFVEASIERFLQAVRGEVAQPLATVADGLTNLRMQLHLLNRAQSVDRAYV